MFMSPIFATPVLKASILRCIFRYKIVNLLLIGTIVSKAKSSADVPELIERAVSILRTTLRQEDWEIYQHYGKKSEAAPRDDA